MKKVNEYVNENEKEDIEYIAIGKKAAGFIARTGNTLVADYSPSFTDNIEPVFIKNIMKTVIEVNSSSQRGTRSIWSRN